MWIIKLDPFKQITLKSYYKVISVETMNRPHSVVNSLEVIMDKQVNLIQ